MPNNGFNIQEILSGLQAIGALNHQGVEPSASDAHEPSWLDAEIVQIGGPEQDIGQADFAIRSTPLEKIFIGLNPPVDEIPLDVNQINVPDWREHGVDILAWYLNFHSRNFQGSVQYRPWGIYIRSRGIEILSDVLESSGVPRIQCPQLAFNFLREHELGHFGIEMLSTSIELGSGTSFFLSGRLAGPAWIEIEEGVCNNMARQALPGNFKSALDSWLSVCPSGYRDWRKHTPARRNADLATIISAIHFDADGRLPTSKYAPTSSILTWLPQPDIAKIKNDVPVYLVKDGLGPDGLPLNALLGPLCIGAETEAFKKDLKKLKRPGIQKLWEATKEKLSEGNLTGVHLERIKNSQGLLSAQVGGDGVRAALKQDLDSGLFIPVAIDNHDHLYARMRRS